MNVILCTKPETPIMSCELHSHQTWEIVLHLSGHNTTVIGGRQYSISEGDVIIIPPKTPHSSYSDVYYTDMYFWAETLDFFDTIIVHDIDSNIQMLMNMLHKTLAEKEANYSHIADNLTETICSYIKKLLKTDYKYPFVNTLKNTIYNNISNTDFDLTAEIRNSGFNKDYLRRCFKEDTGKTPLEYMTWLRLNQAKIFLIQDTFISIEDVSKKCGFNDSFYFSTCFKKHIGTAPLQFRKQRYKS